MGTHILSDAIIRVAAQSKNIHAKAKEVVLAASDIDTQYFNEEISPKLPSIAQHITLYCSNNDTAITTSQRVHLDYSRIGDCRSKATEVNSMDIIDASEANDSTLGHAYVAESDYILNDMFYLIKNHLPAKDRINLSRSGSISSRRWIFKKPIKD